MAPTRQARQAALRIQAATARPSVAPGLPGAPRARWVVDLPTPSPEALQRARNGPRRAIRAPVVA